MSDGRTEIVRLMPRLRRYARALLGNPDQADDLVQASVERGLSRMHLWRHGTDLRAWLFTIMHNLYVNDVARARIRPDSVSLDDGRAGAVDGGQDDVVALHAIVGQLRQLPAEQRQTVLLIGLEEMTYRQAAAVMGVPVGTVMSRLARARERLRELNTERRQPLKVRSVS
jgi:RNA polymerase sigma-70 factor (ECF subfamily)